MNLEAVTSVVGVWLSAFLTLAIFSFLFKDNPFYKLAEHLVVGVSAGYTAVILFTTSFKDLLLDPLMKDFQAAGTFSSLAGLNLLFMHLIPFALGLMMWLRLHPKTSWVGRFPLALFLGVGSGLNIPTYLQTFVIQPLRATLLPIVPGTLQASLSHSFLGSFLIGIGHWLAFDSPASSTPVTWQQAINNLVIVGGTFCAIVYFFFSKEHTGLTGRMANIGIWVLMIGFGSTFGFTVMSRVSLLVGRFEFLMNTWLRDGIWRHFTSG